MRYYKKKVEFFPIIKWLVCLMEEKGGSESRPFYRL